jgi:membrane protein YqaA with SNARE-associated domain
VLFSATGFSLQLERLGGSDQGALDLVSRTDKPNGLLECEPLIEAVVESLKNLLLTWGAPGLFFICLLDSAGVPLPGGPDAVVMLLSWQRPNLLIWIALTAAAGSTIGNWFLYQVGKRGGELALARFDERKRAWVTDKLRRNDILAIVVAMLGPPPFPTKLFVLVAGVFEMRPMRFLLTVFAARWARYLGAGYLGARFGDHAAEVLQQHYGTIAVVLLAVVVGAVVAKYLRRRKVGSAGQI